MNGVAAVAGRRAVSVGGDFGGIQAGNHAAAEDVDAFAAEAAGLALPGIAEGGANGVISRLCKANAAAIPA